MHNYDPKNRPIAHAIVKVLGDEGATLANADGEVTNETLHATIVGYLAGFETALHVAICGEGEGLVKVLAMSMDLDIHEGETDFHDIAETLIGDLKLAMMKALVEAEGGVVVEMDADTTDEQMRMKMAEVIARLMPPKPVSDA